MFVVRCENKKKLGIHQDEYATIESRTPCEHERKPHSIIPGACTPIQPLLSHEKIAEKIGSGFRAQCDRGLSTLVSISEEGKKQVKAPQSQTPLSFSWSEVNCR